MGFHMSLSIAKRSPGNAKVGSWNLSCGGIREKRHVSMEREHAPEVKSALPLERELQTELHLTRIESAGSLTEIAAGVLVMRSTAYRSKNEVGMVEHVEGIGVELYTHTLRDFENLRQRHISSPVPRTDKRVTPQVADTSQTRT